LSARWAEKDHQSSLAVNSTFHCRGSVLQASIIRAPKTGMASPTVVAETKRCRKPIRRQNREGYVSSAIVEGNGNGRTIPTAFSTRTVIEEGISKKWACSEIRGATRSQIHIHWCGQVRHVGEDRFTCSTIVHHRDEQGRQD